MKKEVRLKVKELKSDLMAAKRGQKQTYGFEAFYCYQGIISRLEIILERAKA